MELKNYQKKVIADLQNYLHSLKQSANLAEAWKNYWQTKDIAVGNGGVPAYKDNIQGCLHEGSYRRQNLSCLQCYQAYF